MFVLIKYSKSVENKKNEVLYLINEPFLEVELILIFHNKSLIIVWYIWNKLDFVFQHWTCDFDYSCFNYPNFDLIVLLMW